MNQMNLIQAKKHEKKQGVKKKPNYRVFFWLIYQKSTRAPIPRTKKEKRRGGQK